MSPFFWSFTLPVIGALIGAIAWGVIALVIALRMRRRPPPDFVRCYRCKLFSNLKDCELDAVEPGVMHIICPHCSVKP